MKNVCIREKMIKNASTYKFLFHYLNEFLSKKGKTNIFLQPVSGKADICRHMIFIKKFAPKFDTRSQKRSV